MPATVKENDRVLFYFAGHGVARDGDEGPNGYLLPSDAQRGDESTYLHMPLVHDALLALPCRHMLVLLDSCFSGAFRWSGTRDAEVEVDVAASVCRLMTEVFRPVGCIRDLGCGAEHRTHFGDLGFHGFYER